MWFISTQVLVCSGVDVCVTGDPYFICNLEASSASGCGTLGGVGRLEPITFLSHFGEVNITTDGVLVPGSTREVTGAVRRVSVLSLKGVEVVWGTGGVGVPLLERSFLGFEVPSLPIEFTIVFGLLESSGTDSEGGRGESGGRSGEGKDKSRFELQCSKKEFL